MVDASVDDQRAATLAASVSPPRSVPPQQKQSAAGVSRGLHSAGPYVGEGQKTDVPASTALTPSDIHDAQHQVAQHHAVSLSDVPSWASVSLGQVSPVKYSSALPIGVQMHVGLHGAGSGGAPQRWHSSSTWVPGTSPGYSLNGTSSRFTRFCSLVRVFLTCRSLHLWRAVLESA